MESTNVTQLSNGTTTEKPKIEVKMPTFRDGMNFVGALAAGDAGEMLGALDRGFNEAAFVFAIKSALRSPAAREEVLFVLADLWTRPVSALEVDEPPEEWEYDPDPALVEAGKAVSREEQWRMFSKKSRRRIVKKLMLEEFPLTMIEDFADAFKRLPYVADFLASRETSRRGEDGSSETESPEDTDGETRRSTASTAPESVESSKP